MPFCHAPWTNLDISPQGTISPCCKFRHAHYPDPVLNINEHSIDEYQRSKTLIKIKEEFQQGQWPMGCERCYIEEQNGIESKRQLDYERWKLEYDDYRFDDTGIITASVAFGNTCNLSCITCGPFSSSRWQKEHKALTNIDILPNHFYKKTFVNDFVAHAPNLIHIDIPGGEPFLSGVTEQMALLEEYVRNGRSKNITLHYTTNATIFPDSRWWDIWKDFREIDIQLSIDGIGLRFEYIRYPAEWSAVLDVVQKYLKYQETNSNLRLSLSHTVSVYNIRYLPEFFDWCHNIGLPRPWLGRVHEPAYMRPSVWPEEAKRDIIDHLDSHPNPDCRVWADFLAKNDDSIYWQEFKTKSARHDQYRGLDFCTVFPEMVDFYNS